MIVTKTIDKSKAKIRITQSRPPEKSNEIHEIIINGKKFVNERPTYKLKKFDMDMMRGMFKEPEIVYGKQKEIFFDQDGLWWVEEDMGSQGMMRFFINNPARYIEIASRKTQDTKKVIETLKEVFKTIENKDVPSIIANLKKLRQCYYAYYGYHFFTYIVFDELLLKFRQTLKRFLPNRDASIYMCEFLQGEMTKEAIKHGAIEETVELIRNPTASQSKQIVFYREPKIFFASEHDNSIIAKLFESNPSEELKKEFFALRLIVPIGVQLSEEAQYIESKSLWPMMRILVDNIAEVFLENGIIKEKEQVKDFDSDEMLEILEGLDKNKGNENEMA